LSRSMNDAAWTRAAGSMSASVINRTVMLTRSAYQDWQRLFATGHDGAMRIVVAPDSFGGMLAADEVAEAFATGWREVAPADDLVMAPLSDGGPGLLRVLSVGLDADQVEVDAVGPTGRAGRAHILRVGSTGYVESALACGLEALRHDGGDVRTATTYGVGQLIAAVAALDGVDTVVVGLGGSGTNDGGAGMWAALGAEPAEILRGGGVALRALEQVSLPGPLDVRLIAATDVDNPLLGLHGASAVYGPQKGADQAAVMSLDIGLERWADLVEAATGSSGIRNQSGAGAAGGLGFGLLALGAERVSGIELVMTAVGLATKVDGADLVVTGEGRFDATSLRGKVASGVAQIAQQAGVPCVVVAGQASVGVRDAAASGIDEVWSVAEALGSIDAAMAAGADGVRELGRRVARSWSR
jgi:glycerate kinase